MAAGLGSAHGIHIPDDVIFAIPVFPVMPALVGTRIRNVPCRYHGRPNHRTNRAEKSLERSQSASALLAEASPSRATEIDRYSALAGQTLISSHRCNLLRYTGKHVDARHASTNASWIPSSRNCFVVHVRWLEIALAWEAFSSTTTVK